MVLITGVIKNTDGTPYVGSVKFALNDLGIELNTVYLPTVVTVDSEGTFTVDLWPNTNSLTSTYYKCSLDNGSVFNISIPGDNLSYSLGDVILIDPGTLDPEWFNLIEANITIRVSDLEHYTGIADKRIPSIAISGDYPDAVAGKVSKILTIGDGLTGGTYRGDTDVTVAVDETVIRATDDRLSDDREWVAQTAPLEVVSQPTNTTRYAWTPQRIWDAIVSWFSTITSDDILEGSSNLYYTDSRVANNLAVQANTNKVSATGPVTTHNDITSAGSGQIITTPERTKLSNIEDNAQVNTVNSVAGKTGEVVLDSSDVGLENVPNIDTTNANNITSGTLSGSRLSYGTMANTPAQGNDARFTDSREWTASTVSQSVAQAGTDTNRHAWTSQRVRDNVSAYTQPYSSTEKSKLAGLNSANYLPVEGTAVNSQLLDNIDSSQFLRSDTSDTMTGSLTVSGTIIVDNIENVASISYNDDNANLSLGKDALINVTTGTENTALGSFALTSNESGRANTAAGRFALNSNTTGTSNSALGVDALSSNTGGIRNSAFGNESLSNNTSGSFNSAFGRDALVSNTTGNANSAFGVNVLSRNTTGSLNLALGSGSLRSNEIGHNNVSLGNQAGFNSNGSGNVFIGFRAGYNETGSNTLYISNTSTTTPLVYGDFSTSELQINGGLTVTNTFLVLGGVESSQVITDNLEVSNNTTISGLLKASRLNSLDIVLNNTVQDITPLTNRGIFAIAFTGTSNNSSSVTHQMESSGLIAYDIGGLKFLSVLTSNSNGLVVVGENDPAGELQPNKIVVGVTDGALRLRSTWDENTLTSITFIA